MATSATWYDRLLGKSVEAHAEQIAQSGTRRVSDYKLRPFMMEDVHLFSKRIDNSRVIRQQDPQAPKACWTMIGGASASAVLLIGMLLPSGYRVMAGYQIEELKKERESLERSKAELELEEAKLLSPGRLTELARIQEFVDPDPSRVVHFGEKPAEAVATRRNTPTPVAAIRTRPAPPALAAAQPAETAEAADASVEIPQ